MFCTFFFLCMLITTISIRLEWNAQTLLRGTKEAFRQCKVWLQPIENRLKMGVRFFFFLSFIFSQAEKKSYGYLFMPHRDRQG